MDAVILPEAYITKIVKKFEKQTTRVLEDIINFPPKCNDEIFNQIVRCVLSVFKIQVTGEFPFLMGNISIHNIPTVIVLYERVSNDYVRLFIQAVLSQKIYIPRELFEQFENV